MESGKFPNTLGMPQNWNTEQSKDVLRAAGPRLGCHLPLGGQFGLCVAHRGSGYWPWVCCLSFVQWPFPVVFLCKQQHARITSGPFADISSLQLHPWTQGKCERNTITVKNCSIALRAGCINKDMETLSGVIGGMTQNLHTTLCMHEKPCSSPVLMRHLQKYFVHYTTGKKKIFSKFLLIEIAQVSALTRCGENGD